MRKLACANSDDPAYFGGYIEDNLRACTRDLGLTARELLTLVCNGFEASFLDADSRGRHIEEAHRVFAATHLGSRDVV